MPPLTLEQTIVFAALVAALVLFVWGRWRYDLVALGALLALALVRIVPAEEAFLGFGHPAVITVAAVLIASRGLQNAGVVDLLAGWGMRAGKNTTMQVAVLTLLVAVASAFMNNVGALALLMPVAIRMGRKSGTPPSLLLMPLAFGSLLGGLVTLIGTPPNIIVATFRARVAEQDFGMFDFAPVGGGVAAAGIVFLALVGWRLIPKRKARASREELFEIEAYTTEVRVPEGSKMLGHSLGELEDLVEKEDLTVVGLIRGEQRTPAPSDFELLRSGDVLIVEGDPDSLKELVQEAGLELVGSKHVGEKELGSEEISLVEAIVAPDASLLGRTIRQINLRRRFGVNLLAVARQGERLKERLGRNRLRAGDVLLLQGPTDAVQEVLGEFGLLPLAERGLRLGQPRRLAMALGIFGAAIALITLRALPPEIAFTLAAVAMVLTGLLTLRESYQAIDWPVIVLLAAMIPVGAALETTGGAELVAAQLLRFADVLPPWATLTILLVGTMLLSNVINNAAAALLMCPIALGIAEGLGASPDTFLMGVAVGASCAFLTPIGHQSNTLVLGPGGYQFGDYWKMGLPLSILVTAAAIPLLLRFWPL
jgi:di/tricarboxylate transporter